MVQHVGERGGGIWERKMRERDEESALSAWYPSQDRVPRGAHMLAPYFQGAESTFALICPISTALGGYCSFGGCVLACCLAFSRRSGHDMVARKLRFCLRASESLPGDDGSAVMGSV